jgi:outer membrane receptor protein involved in Fe transport
MTGERQILSRGVGFGYGSGNIKLLLDGVSMNSSLLATANPVLNIPIEQIERIEVIRGPGSSVHGEDAFAGVVNVITRRNDRTLQAQANERAAAGGGGIWRWSDPHRELSASINLTGLAGTGGVPVTEDALFPIGEPELSNAPGSSNEASRYLGGFADLRCRDTFIALKVLDDDYGDHFGINHFLPPSNDRLASEQIYVSVQIGRDLILFQSDLTDPIVFGEDDDGFINNADARLRGVELEYRIRLGTRVKIDANLSYVDAVSRGTDASLPGGTDIPGNLALLWRPVESWTAAIQLRYVGDRSRPEFDPRPSLSGYATADLTLSYQRPGPCFFAHLGVKNLTDEDVRHPDLPTGYGGIDLLYADGYPRPGRRWWLSGCTF